MTKYSERPPLVTLLILVEKPKGDGWREELPLTPELEFSLDRATERSPWSPTFIQLLSL